MNLMTDDVAAHSLAPPHSLGIEAAPGMSGWGDALRRRLGYGGRSRVLAVIPARWASTRFPGKPVKYVVQTHYHWDHARGGGV